MIRDSINSRVVALKKYIYDVFSYVIVLVLCSTQFIYADNAKVRPEVLITSGTAFNEDGKYHVQFSIGEVVLGNGEYNVPSNSDNTVGIGFYIGDVISPRCIHYYIGEEEVYTDTIIPGCDIIPFEPPVSPDSVFVSWFPSLPAIMPDKDLNVSAFYRPAKWEIKSSKPKYCPGEFAEFILSSDDGLKGLYEYKVEYVSSQLSGGFVQYGYERLDVYGEDSVKFEIPIPNNYIGEEEEEFRVRFKYIDGRESNIMLFKCKIDLPSSLLLVKYGELIILDNKKINAEQVVWFKDDAIVSRDAGIQYSESPNLYGEYSAVVRLEDQTERRICSRSIYVETSLEQGIIVDPNPAKRDENIRVSIKGFSMNQLQGALLDVFDVLGSRKIMQVTSLDNDIDFTLQQGVYIVSLRLATGKVYATKFIVY